MMKSSFIFVLFFILVAPIYAKQHSEATCILLKQQINRYSEVPNTRQYKTAKSQFDNFCEKPVTHKIENVVLTNGFYNEAIVEQPTVLTERDALIEKSTLSVIKPPTIVQPKAISPQEKSPISENLVNLTPIFFNMLMFFVMIFIFTLLLKWVRSPHRRGAYGEYLVNQKLASLCEDHDYRFYKNVLLELDGELTEIDHIVVSTYGIFVIETKHYRGWIFGDETQARWTQKMRYSKASFMNPLRQNYKHCLAVQQLLGLVVGVNSVVVFSDSAEFKTALPSNVLQLNELIPYIKMAQNTVFSFKQLGEFNAKLQNRINDTTKADYKTHLQQVQNRLST